QLLRFTGKRSPRALVEHGIEHQN
ncbi:MAG: hypothetical protein QOG09_219, partial [Solirubrobacterales bacterium]|nr:hypothetical protein [Solirubrobacterales bacterium]